MRNKQPSEKWRKTPVVMLLFILLKCFHQLLYLVNEWIQFIPSTLWSISIFFSFVAVVVVVLTYPEKKNFDGNLIGTQHSQPHNIVERCIFEHSEQTETFLFEESWPNIVRLSVFNSHYFILIRKNINFITFHFHLFFKYFIIFITLSTRPICFNISIGIQMNKQQLKLAFCLHNCL